MKLTANASEKMDGWFRQAFPFWDGGTGQWRAVSLRAGELQRPNFQVMIPWPVQPWLARWIRSMVCLGEAARRKTGPTNPTGLHLKIGGPLETWKPLFFRGNMFFCGIFWWFHEKTPWTSWVISESEIWNEAHFSIWNQLLSNGFLAS